MRQSKEIKQLRAEKAKSHYKDMEEQYHDKIFQCVRDSKIYSHFSPAEKSVDAKPEFVFKNVDSVTAVLNFCEGKTAVLNFASYKNPGGGFMNGMMAQEEALCHESFLYNVLVRMSSFYEYNREHMNRGLYENRAIYSPNVIFERYIFPGIDGPEVTNFRPTPCDVITCASPNNIMGARYHKFPPEENSRVLRKRIKFIKDIAEDQSVETLILGAFGCGVFMQDPEEVAQVFKETFETSAVKKIIMAVPGHNHNTEIFRSRFE